MEVKVEKAKLEKVIKRIGSLAKVKSALPIVSNFHISVKENEMFLTATQLEIWGIGWVECESKDKFEICVDAQKFTAIVNNSKDVLKLKYDSKNRKVIISYGHSTHRLSIEPAEDFPQPSEIENPKSVKIPNIAKLFKRTTHAMDDLRRNMAGIFIANDSIRASDGFRAIISHVETGVESGMLVPSQTAHIIAGLPEPDVEIVYNENDMKIVAGNISYHSKLIDDTFPNIDNVIPKEFTIKYSANTEDFKKAMQTIMISTDALDTTRRTELTFNEDTLIITTINNEIGAESTDQIPYKLERGDVEFPQVIVVNGKYLLDLLNIIETEEVSIDLPSFEAGKAHVVKNDQFTYLLMPLRRN